MSEPSKRPRMELDDSDADFSRKESLFMEALPRGLSDTLPLIFKHLSSLKDKIRLERVCKAFRHHGKSLEAWSNVKCINIEYDFVLAYKDEDDNYYQINDDLVPERIISQAIRSIFSRSRNLKKLHLSCQMSTVAYESTVESILQYGSASSYKNLQAFHLDCCHNTESGLQIVQLISIFKHQLTDLELCGLYFYNSSLLTMELWREIGECANLTSLVVGESGDAACQFMMERALSGKKLRMLDLGGCCTSADGLIEIVFSLADQSLRILAFNGHYCSYLSEFVEKLPPAKWNSIEEMRYYIHKVPMGSVDRNWSAILTLPRTHPHLQKLMLRACCKHSQAVELVLSFLKILNESSSTRSLVLVHQLNLLGNGWKSVFDVLGKKHKCEIVRNKENDYRVRCPRLGRNDIRLIEQH